MDAAPQPPRSRIDWVQVFFSSTGRMGRGLFVLATALLLVLVYGYDAAADGVLRLLTGWAVFSVLFFSAACVLSKRLHDRGRSGWWAALVLWAFLVVWPEPEGAIDLVFCLALAAAAVELCLRPGQGGANRFGPPA